MLSGLRIGVAVSWGVGRRRSWDLVWLWQWLWLAATAPLGPLAWEPPCAKSAALENKNKKAEPVLSVLRAAQARSLGAQRRKRIGGGGLDQESAQGR